MTSTPTSLTVESMMQSFPQHTGNVSKFHSPMLYEFLPRFLQAIVLKWRCLACLRPSWKPRFLVLLGSFLYKFSNNNNGNSRLKGTPIGIETLTIRRVPYDQFDSHCVFMVGDVRKETYFQCPTAHEADEWVRSLGQAQHECIKRSMGHVDKDSYPASWERMDRLGRSLCDSKTRIRKRLDEKVLRETEMSNLGGPVPQGYFG